MGSYCGTCHLSSLLIKEGEEVVLIPTRYASLKETTTMCYGTNGSASLFLTPIFGKSDGFGSITINKESEFVANELLSMINNSLQNNPDNRGGNLFTSKPHKFCVFKGSNDASDKPSGWLNRSQINWNGNEPELGLNESQLSTMNV